MATKATPKKKATHKKAAAKTVSKKEEPRKSCFVMIPFKDPFDLYYSSIYKPAIESANMKPIRADDLFRPSVIVSDIWSMIRDADVLIGELTFKNANVFYELGLAHAIGKPVILVSETMSDVPFDLQQLRVLLYNKDNPSWGEALKADIKNSILEVLDDPIEAVPTIFRKKIESFAPEQDVILSRVDELESQVRFLRMQFSMPSETRTKLSRLRDELEHVTSADQMDEVYMKYRRILPKSILLREIDQHPRIPDLESERLKNKL